MSTSESEKKQPKKDSTSFNTWYHNLPELKKILYFSILIPLTISLIVSPLSYLILENYQSFREQKNIAQGIKIEFESMEPELNQHTLQWENFSPCLKPGYNLENDKTDWNNVVPLTPIYSDYGVYFLYGKDIYKEDSELSKLLYTCYINLNNAEYNRKQTFNVPVDQNYQFITSVDRINSHRYQCKMAIQTKACVDIIPRIKTLLVDKENSKFLLVLN